MIQRKQSIYLFLTAAICIMMLIADFPISKSVIKVNNVDANYTVSVTGSKIANVYQFKNQYLMICLILSAVVSLVSIFLFKKLKLQRKLVAFNFIFIILVLFFTIFASFNINGVYSVQSKTYQFGFFLPLILLIMNLLSFRGIKKDIELLASVDRLR